MARAAKTAPNNTELSNALTRAEIAETLLADARKELTLLNAKLDIARTKYVEMRDVIRELRAARPVRGQQTAAQRAYQERSAQARANSAAEGEALRAKHREACAAFYEAHPEAKSAALSEVLAWFNQPAPVDCE